MATELVLTGGGYVKDLTGAVWNEISDEGGFQIKLRETLSGDNVTLCEAQCPAGKVWKIRISVSITETDA